MTTMATRRQPKQLDTPTIAGVTITHPDRVLARDPEITKLDMVRYYDAVAEVMLPHLRDRPLTMVQCAPDVANCRYLRHSGASRPPSQVRTIEIQEQTKIGDYMVIDDAAGLIALAQRNILEFHTWNSTTSRLEKPDRIVLDLDPGPAVPWRTVVEAARQIRTLLESLGLRSWLKTTGGAGLHVVIPIVPRRDWSICLAFAKSVASSLVEHDPSRYTITFAKSGRDDKILVDYLRNNRTNTAVCAYSARSRASIPVSVPIAWDELTTRLRPQRWTIRTVPKRVRESAGVWKDYFKSRQNLPL
jgi:bifunctional non-homologous end joining protein LigD